MNIHADSSILVYRINDACKALSLGRSTIYKLINEGKLKPVKIAGRVLIPRAEIERLVSEGTRDA